MWLSLTAVSVVAGLTAGSRGGYARVIARWLMAGQLTVALLAVLSPMGPLAAVAIAANAGVVLAAQLLSGLHPLRSRTINLAWLASGVLTILLLSGMPALGLPTVRQDQWGGLLLTFMLAAISIVLSFPLGVALALGRRSRLPGSAGCPRGSSRWSAACPW